MLFRSVVRAPLSAVPRAVRELGSRPPGLLVVGYACDVLREGGQTAAAVEHGGGDGAQAAPKLVVENGWTVEEGCPWAM